MYDMRLAHGNSEECVLIRLKNLGSNYHSISYYGSRESHALLQYLHTTSPDPMATPTRPLTCDGIISGSEGLDVT